jgi:hypothetical protein
VCLTTLKKMCVCFIDWKKDFDRVNWTKLLEILRNIRVNWRERILIHNLHMGQRVSLKIKGEQTVWNLEEQSDRDVAYIYSNLKSFYKCHILVCYEYIEAFRLKVFGNRKLRRIFGHKRDANGEWRRLHNKEYHRLYRSPNID